MHHPSRLLRPAAVCISGLPPYSRVDRKSSAGRRFVDVRFCRSARVDVATLHAQGLEPVRPAVDDVGKSRDRRPRCPRSRVRAWGQFGSAIASPATMARATGEGSDPSSANPSRTCTAGWATIRSAVPRCGQVAVCTTNGWHKRRPRPCRSHARPACTKPTAARTQHRRWCLPHRTGLGTAGHADEIRRPAGSARRPGRRR
jgi:hypothetical protein